MNGRSLRIRTNQDLPHLRVRAGCVWFKCHIRYCIPPFLIEKGRDCIILWYSRTMQCPAAVIFDLDDTLAESFHAPSPQALAGVGKLLERIPISIITGAAFLRMHEQFLATFETHTHADRLYVFPTSSAQAYRFSSGTWEQLYDLALDEEARAYIKRAIVEAVNSLEV